MWNALVGCAVEANNPAESSDFARGVRCVLEALSGAAYADGNWGTANRLLEILDSIDWRRLSEGTEDESLADRLIRRHGTVVAEYILSKALKRVCGIPGAATAISQMLILEGSGMGVHENTSMLAAQMADRRKVETAGNRSQSPTA